MSKKKKKESIDYSGFKTLYTADEYKNKGNSGYKTLYTADDYKNVIEQRNNNLNSSWDRFLQQEKQRKQQQQMTTVQTPIYYYDRPALNLNSTWNSKYGNKQNALPSTTDIMKKPAGGNSSSRYDPSKLMASAGVSDTRSGRTSGGGGNPGQTQTTQRGLSAQEKGKWINKTISELQRQYDAAMQQSMTIDRYKNPKGAMKAQRDAEDLRRRIEENKMLLEQNNAEIAKQQTAQNGKETGNTWDMIQNQKIRERQAFPKFMTERPEDYNDRDEEYDRDLYDFYYGKGAYDTISRSGNRNAILQRMSDVRDLWADFDNGNVAKVAQTMQPKIKTRKEYKIPEDIDRYGAGNIDLDNRQVVKNKDGSISTERSFSVNIDGKEVLLPTVINGKIVSEEEAIRHYEQTGEHLGKFDTPEEANEYAEKLHQRQEKKYGQAEDPLKDYAGRSYTYGGEQRPMTISEQYEATDPGMRGAYARTALDMKNYQAWMNAHGMDSYKGLDDENKYWTNVKNSTDEIKREIEEDPNRTIDGIELISDEDFMLYDLIQEYPELIKNPVHSEENNRKIYDFYSGEPGIYDLEKDDPEREARLAKYWEDIDNGYAGALANKLQSVKDTREAYDYVSAVGRKANRQLQEIEVKQNKAEKYNELINKYDDILDEDLGNFVPEDRGGNAYNSLADFERGVQTNDIHRIYSLVSGGNEFQSWAGMIQQFGQEPRISSEYNYAMLLKDGSDGGANEIKIFEDLYKKAVMEGREPTEAREFLNGLQNELHQRYEEANEIGIAEAARQYPVLASLASIMMHQANTLMYIPRKAAELLGDESVKDPYSDWYAPTQQADKIESTIAGDLGGFAGKIYLNVMNSANNLIRGLSTAGLGSTAQQIVGLGSMFAQVAQESTARYLDKYDYNTASKFGAIDGLFEVLQEFLPFETMLGSEGKSIWKSLRNNVLAEIGQEFSGASWMKKLEGLMKGDQEDVARADEIITQQGYYNEDGQWIDLSPLKNNKDVLMEFANMQASKEFWQEAVESGLAGGFGGGISSTYGTITNALGTSRVGKTVNSQQNVIDGLTGAQQMVKTALGMEGTESQVQAQKIDAKMQKGQKPSNYEIGKLTATMAEETNEQVQNVVQETVQRRVLGQLKEAGVTGKGAVEIADAITRGLTGEKMTKADREIIAKDARAIQLWKSYNTFMSEDYAGVREDVEKATEPVRSVANLIGDLTGKYNKAKGAMSDEIDLANRTAKTVDEAIDTLAKRNAGLISEEYAALAKQEAGTDENKNHQKTFLNDAVQIRLAAFSLNKTMPKTNIDQASAQRLWEAAQKEFQEKDAQRIKNQVAIVPGKGDITYEGEKYGSDGWKEKVRGLKGPVRQQVQAIAYIANRLGHTVNFVFDDSKIRDNNGKVVSDSRFVHGYESGNGAITINVAGMLANGARKNMMVTIAHEMTHWLEQNSAEGYAALREFLLSNLRAKGMNVEQRMVDLINNQKSVLKGTGQELDMNGAMAELVAQSCEELMSSQELISRLEAENPNLYTKIKSFLQNLISKLTSGAEDSLSQEARLLTDLKEDIAKMWFAAREEALNRKAGGAEDGEGVSFSVSQLSDGTKYVEVDTEQEQFAGLKPKQMLEKAQQIIRSKFVGKNLPYDGGTARVDNRTAGEYSHPANRAMKEAEKRAKGKASTELDNLVKIGKRLLPSDPDYPNPSYGHKQNANTVGYKYYKTLFRVNGRWFTGIVNIEQKITPDSKKRYDRIIDITQIKEDTSRSVATGNSPTAANKAVGAASAMGSIQQNQNTGKSLSVAQISTRSLADLEQDYEDAYNSYDDDWGEKIIAEMAERAMNDSKVRDENGKLKIVYHQTNADPFTVFNMDKARQTEDVVGAFFAPEFDQYHEYGDRTYAVYLNITNPAYDVYDMDLSETDAGLKKRNELIAQGYDGVINTEDGKVIEYVAFYPEQIKSAEAFTEDDDGDLIPLIQRFNKWNEDIRFSVAQMDTEGRKLSPGQQEFFRDSKAVDEEGRLVKLYHGTNQAGFFTFTKTDDIGYFFTDDPMTAMTYSDTREQFAPRRAESWEDVNSMIRDSGYEYRQEEDGRYHLYDIENNEDVSMWGGTYAADDYETAMERDVWQSIVRDNDGKLNYAVYANITNPLIIEGNGSNWSAVVDSAGGDMYTWDELTKEQQREIADNMGMTLKEAKAQGWDEDGLMELAVYDINNMEIREAMKTRDWVARAEEQGYDGVIFRDIMDEGQYGGGMPLENDVYVVMEPNQVKSVDNLNPTDDNDIRYSVAQLAEANGFRFDEDAVALYNKEGKLIDGVKVKVTEDMIEKTPIGMLINMARDGVTTKGGKVKFKSTISAETAKAQKKMFADLMNMVARYKDSNLVWEIAGSTLYSALKANSDPQYKTTVDFGTVCAKTQEIINVMSRVMLEKGRGLTREEVLMVYNETANAGLTVPCPVCYVFSRWMGVPSLLNSISEYQKRFVIPVKDKNGKPVYDKDGKLVIDKKATQEEATKYIKAAMKKYGSKAALDKAKTSIINRMKTQEKNRTDALVVANSSTATTEEKQAAKIKHDKAIKELDALTKDLAEVEAYNWVTQALCKETSKGSGKYVFDPEFEYTPDNILFDLRRTGDFAKFAKNWRYRNTRGAGMGKAIMPYSGMSIGDIIYGTERKTVLKNAFLQMKGGSASTAMKNAIIRARKQNLVGGQRLQSTSDFRPEWGLDYIMTFLELQAIGSKVQMYTKVAEAVDLLASMQADVNLSIMGAGSGYHLATAAEIREAQKNTKRGRDLRSRMGTTYDENGKMQTYVMDFSDVTGMDYDTAKALKDKHDSVQMILVGMNDIHIRLALANPDIDFIIPWHSSGNTKDALESMISSVGEKLETSSDYQDAQSDKPAANQTAEQKQLWELRMKILQGKNITAAEKKIIDGDEWLSDLWERFNVEGVDTDCYQVEMDADQAGQIFPYEYWNKKLAKAEANENGLRFIEYCKHFGITPRFSGVVKTNEDGTFTVTGNFAGAIYDDQGNITGYDPKKMTNGYWKVLIDRPMYDNKGRYRDQQVVDVTKAKVGSLDAKGRLQDSDMPLKTSAMYGDNYSEQEKDATDNTLAALDAKAQLEAIGKNVLNDIQPVRPNQSAFGASAGVPTMNTQAVSEQEVYAPKKQKARYVNEDDRAFSVMQPDIAVTSFMMGLNENSLSTAQEKIMLRQFKEIKKTMEVAEMAVRERTASLRKLEAKENPTAFDREEMRKLKNQITNWQKKYDRSEEQLGRITRGSGYARLMQQQGQTLSRLASGRTHEEVRKTVEALTKMLQDVTKEIDAREKQIGTLKDDLAYRKTATLINRTAADKVAALIRKEYGSSINKQDLVRELTTIRLKMARKMDIDDDVMNLAWKIAENTAADGGESLRSLRGTTITLGAGQVKELLGTDGSLKELRSIFAGTGIKVRTAKEGQASLDADWKELCDAVPELDRSAKELDQVNELIRFVQTQKSQMSGAGMFKGNMDEFAEDLKAMIATIGVNAPNDPAAVKVLDEMSKLVDSMAAGVQTSTDELRQVREQIVAMVNQGRLAMSQQDAMQYEIEKAIKYNNALTEQSEAELWKSERRKLIDQLNSETTEKLITEQQKWKDRIARDKTARDMMQSNMQLRKSINTNVTRLRKLLVNETDLKNIPEHMKSLTREMLGMIVRNDLTGRKLTGIAKQDLIELDRILGIMKEQDGEFTLDDLRLITDEEAQSVVEDALADIEDGIRFYNASSSGGILTTLQGMHNALDRISEAVSTITSVIHAEQSISIGERRVLVADAAEEVAYDMRGSRFKGETRGRGSRQINMARKAVLWGNLTPVYFFRNLKNRGMMKQWKELTSAENRNGLELQKAAARIREIADKANYKEWTGQTHKVKFGGRTFDITIDQMMSLYAIWKREKELNPQMSNHLQQGGVIFDKEESTTGRLRKETTETRPVKISDADVQAMYDMLTEEQKTYLDEIVSYLSNDMSELGNEASMKMYGIKKYKEKWYFPMQVWDGVKSARSDRGISGTNENRAAHKSWSKRRINKASNALIIGDFTQIAVGHIVEMINYNTVAPAIENINKILNYQRNEQAEQGIPESGVVKRNIRVMFQQAYGQQALNYLETFLQDLNGGTVQDQRKTLREAALSMFKKNAVAGSLSVALQQPLSYIRAAMMINPMYLARALNPTYWKGSQAEMMKYSGVAVIKAMGRFDMNFGRSAKDFVAPDKPEGIYSRISDKLTAAPELMDTMTWTRMWSAVKIEQHALHKDMDITSDEFLKIVAERFNEVMQRTQVYDSVMVKSQNMRSNNYAMKIVTSFMAEPTLSLNVLADAVQGAITKTEGWKKTLMSAGATFALSAAAQAFVKGLMGSGRTPDEKKTWLENFLYKWYSAFLGEVNPLGLIPGYSDIIELIKNGELNDDAMGAIGKIFTTIDTAGKAIQGKGKGWYRDLEDTAAQLAQLFTNVPAKNIMRDLRAMFNWISQAPYAKRETSGAVLRLQTQAAFWNADSLIGAINAKLGEAGYKTSNKAYYGRMFDAMQRGNQAEADDIREYMMLAKGAEEKDITSGLKTAAKERLEAVEADEWMISNNMMESASTLTTQYIKGQITKDEYKKLLKKQNPKMTADEIWWAVDQADFKKETGVDSKPTGKNYRLDAAIEANSTEAIRKAINEMTAHGVDKKSIKSQYLSKWKDDYLEAGSDKRRKIRDALQKAYKILGYTAEDANKTIEKWESDAKKKN